MDRNFKVRLIVGLGMFVVALISLYTFNSVPFKIIFCLFAFVAAIELLSFFHNKFTIFNAVLALIELSFLIGGAIFVVKTNLYYFWYIILGVCGYDVFAYMFGKAFGGKIFKNSRPFPHISKNKTWEGTILGLLSSIGMMLFLMTTRGSLSMDYIYLLCAPLALTGDLFESFLKRKFNVKDSNEIVIKDKTFEKLEYAVGGTVGHGGFLDRIDSVSFTATILLIVSSLL